MERRGDCVEVVIITGMSGAGKSSAMRFLEDMDCFCIDNLPPDLLPGLLQAYKDTEDEMETLESRRSQKLAIGIDVRSLIRFGDIASDFKDSFPKNCEYTIIFMEAATETLVSRYKQSRRNHPLAQTGNLIEAINEERNRLKELRGISDLIIDTTEMNLPDLKDFLFESLTFDEHDELMTVFIQSFGFKYGIPLDSDMVFDVRFLPNPFYIEELRELSGLDAPVKDYILQFDQVHKFLEHIQKFFAFSLPLYQKEGKVRLTLAIGCTGGRHRSVGITEELAVILRSMGYRILIDHRDIKRDPVGGL